MLLQVAFFGFRNKRIRGKKEERKGIKEKQEKMQKIEGCFVTKYHPYFFINKKYLSDNFAQISNYFFVTVRPSTSYVTLNKKTSWTYSTWPMGVP